MSPDELTTGLWAPLLATTQARIGLGRAGVSLPTSAVLELQEALAAARGAVHVPLDVPSSCPVRLRSGSASRSFLLLRRRIAVSTCAVPISAGRRPGWPAASGILDW